MTPSWVVKLTARALTGGPDAEEGVGTGNPRPPQAPRKTAAKMTTARRAATIAGAGAAAGVATVVGVAAFRKVPESLRPLGGFAIVFTILVVQRG